MWCQLYSIFCFIRLYHGSTKSIKKRNSLNITNQRHYLPKKNLIPKSFMNMYVWTMQAPRRLFSVHGMKNHLNFTTDQIDFILQQRWTLYFLLALFATHFFLLFYFPFMLGIFFLFFILNIYIQTYIQNCFFFTDHFWHTTSIPY